MLYLSSNTTSNRISRKGGGGGSQSKGERAGARENESGQREKPETIHQDCNYICLLLPTAI